MLDQTQFFISGPSAIWEHILISTNQVYEALISYGCLTFPFTNKQILTLDHHSCKFRPLKYLSKRFRDELWRLSIPQNHNIHLC